MALKQFAKHKTEVFRQNHMHGSTEQEFLAGGEHTSLKRSTGDRVPLGHILALRNWTCGPSNSVKTPAMLPPEEE